MRIEQGTPLGRLAGELRSGPESLHPMAGDLADACRLYQGDDARIRELLQSASAQPIATRIYVQAAEVRHLIEQLTAPVTPEPAASDTADKSAVSDKSDLRGKPGKKK